MSRKKLLSPCQLSWLYLQVGSSLEHQHSCPPQGRRYSQISGSQRYVSIIQALRNGGVFFSNVSVKTGEHFLEYKRRTTPMLVYGGLHAAPALLWSIMMPLQHVESLRKKWPAFHRGSGYVILSASLVLSMTGYWFYLSKNAYSHQDWFHVHDLNGWSYIGWPTFELTTFCLAPIYWLTMYKTAVTARAKNFESHRKWAVLHTMAASGISLERVGLVILHTLGYILTLFPRERVHQFLNLPDTNDAMAAAEQDFFAFANVIAIILALSWFVYEFDIANYFSKSKKTCPAHSFTRVATTKQD